MTTATEPVTIEGVDLDAEVPCMSWGPDAPPCPLHADYIIRSCGGVRVSICRTCWEHMPASGALCKWTEKQESRDEHYTIVEVLR